MDRGDARAVNRVALTIAGSDSGGGAGIQADLKTFAALGVYGVSAITALTAQNTRGVTAVHLAPPDIVVAQIESAFSDFEVAAVKIGMLGRAGLVKAVAGYLSATIRGEPHPGPRRSVARTFLVYDPVMVASSGDALAGAGFLEAICAVLLPLVDCLTPNLSEASALLGVGTARSEGEMASQGRALLQLGPRTVLMKGGHLPGDETIDLLVTADGVTRFPARRLASRNLHGTGCTLSSAIAAEIALGASLPEAVGKAKNFVRAAIERGASFALGAGAGPVLQFPLRT